MNLKEIQKAIKYTPLLEVNFAYQRVVSFSQFALYTKCPHSWYMQKIKKVIPDIPNLHFVFGTAIHTTLEHYFKIMYEKSGAAADREDIITLFESTFAEEYKKTYEKYGSHFSSPEQMNEFYEDGVNILNWLKKHRNDYFTLKKTHLLGIELPLTYEVKKNVILNSKLDIVLYDEVLNRIQILDFKTSTSGWRDKDKKDESKYPQLVLYKDYFAKQYNIDPELIDIEYIILKRKIWEQSEYPQKRIQLFSPSSGKNSRNKLTKSFQIFLDDCFDENGKIIEKEYKTNPSKEICKYCPLLNTEHCNQGIK